MAHGIPLIDTPRAKLHVMMTLSSKTPKSNLEDMVRLDSVIHVGIRSSLIVQISINEAVDN